MLRVTTKRGGEGFDITEMIEGLSWSSVNPGGDEIASFTFKQQWSRDNREIAKGSLLRIEDGLERLFTGRIEEQGPGGDQTEEVTVTAYGLGAKLKDNTMSMVYADGDLGQWGDASRALRINTLAAGFKTAEGATVESDQANGLPGLTLSVDPGQVNPFRRSVYDAGNGNTIRGYYVNMTSDSLSTYTGAIGVMSDDIATVYEFSADLLTGTDSGYAGIINYVTARRYGVINFFLLGTVGTDTQMMTIRQFRVYGDHGLTKRGSAPEGFYDSDIVGHVIADVDGVTAGTIDTGSFVIQQAAYKDPVEHEAIIADVAKYEDRDWGTFGDDNLFSPSDEGIFNYTLKDGATRHWSIRRAETAGLDLHTETSTLFDTVIVKYQDAAGTALTVTKTASIPELVDAGLSPKTLTVDGGVMTPALASLYADVWLALTGGFAPARGSIKLEGTIDHYQRGRLPASYMRADGSNIQIPDILPTTTLLAFDDTPDRRTTFPVKRVSHDAGGNTITTTVELDQTNDLLTQLQTRLGETATVTLG